MTLYLTEDIKGAYSKLYYAFKGEQVKIKTKCFDMLCVQSESGGIFWVKENQISTTKIEKDAIKPIIKRKIR